MNHNVKRLRKAHHQHIYLWWAPLRIGKYGDLTISWWKYALKHGVKNARVSRLHKAAWKKLTSLVGNWPGWCSTLTLLLICSWFSRENGDPLPVCSSPSCYLCRFLNIDIIGCIIILFFDALKWHHKKKLWQGVLGAFRIDINISTLQTTGKFPKPWRSCILPLPWPHNLPFWKRHPDLHRKKKSLKASCSLLSPALKFWAAWKPLPA